MPAAGSLIFDNRDIGLSNRNSMIRPSKIVSPVSMRGASCKGIAAEGEPVHERVPYLLDDMAADAAALIEALGAERGRRSSACPWAA
jgi:hypothetical protein